MKGNVLVIAAHPDDEVLGCGGTVCRLTQQGCDLFIAILGEGITSRFTSISHATKQMLNRLHTESHKVADKLGATDLIMLGLPDNRFDTEPLLDIVKRIEELVKRVRPSVVFTHHGGDLNIDHAITFRAVLTVVRPLPECPVKELYAFEIPSSTEWAFVQTGHIFKPDFFVDIGTTLKDKIAALRLYSSEIKEFPHPRSERIVQAMAERRGSTIGVKAAEAFETVFRRI